MLLVIALFVGCLVPSFAVPDECSKGEHFWCESVDNAIKCSALKHCAATVWKNDLTNEKDLFDNCKLCMNFLKNVKVYLEDKTMRQTIKLLMKEELCPMFGDYESTCRVAVDHYSDELIDFLSSEIDPQVICHFLHMCPENVTKKLTFEVESTETFPKCKMCKLFIDEVKKAIGSDVTREKIEEFLEKLCGMIPESLKKQCDDFVKKYSDLIIELLLKDLETEKICEAMHFCPDVKCPAKDLKSIDKCEVCEIILGFIEGILEKNSTISQIEAAVHKVCHFLPCQHRDFCNNLVDEYTTLIVKFIVNNVRPHEACKLMNLCNQTKPQYFKCTAGPKYWCASEANAKLCEAEEHCRKYVWV